MISISGKTTKIKNPFLRALSYVIWVILFLVVIKTIGFPLPSNLEEFTDNLLDFIFQFIDSALYVVFFVFSFIFAFTQTKKKLKWEELKKEFSVPEIPQGSPINTKCYFNGSFSKGVFSILVEENGFYFVGSFPFRYLITPLFFPWQKVKVSDVQDFSTHVVMLPKKYGFIKIESKRKGLLDLRIFKKKIKPEILTMFPNINAS